MSALGNVSNVLAGVVALFYLLAAVCAVRELLYGRSSQGTIAWLLSLAFFPYVTVFVYLAFGWKRFDDYVKIRRPADRMKSELPESRRLLALRADFEDKQAAAAWPLHNAVSPLPFLSGNNAEILIDGEATFSSMLEGIRAATSHVLVQFYILRNDAVGKRLADCLIEKAQAGVTVLLLYDDIGSAGLSRSYLNRLTDAGVTVSGFNRSHPMFIALRPFRINFRNHRKVLVVDGTAAWVGGLNVGDEYLGETRRFGRWRDTHVRVEGPAALACQLSFAEDWQWATRSYPPVPWPDPEPQTDGMPVLVMPTGPADEVETCAVAFTEAIARARKRLWIVSPYFVPGENIATALSAAVLRGVEVRLLLPQKPDHWIVWMASSSYARDMAAHGVRVHSYRGGFLHQKVMLVDDALLSIGTVNCDNRSMHINFEVTLWFTDNRMIAAARRMLEEDFDQSVELNDADFASRGPLWHLLGRIARLFAPLL
ncbi:cardiolipin synthase [Breoghania sp. L-A4]|uniref:cardiolipin synthase n=1 Tax=Breoghania sp. L-A4 TaxID=2304600 RepID=UPI000E35A75B|nr:cardiolipin synthase [Breoghania sp. L-A4]AXS40917.1 cardiolipin synthase [Breoghania sp. L-A4]